MHEAQAPSGRLGWKNRLFERAFKCSDGNTLAGHIRITRTPKPERKPGEAGLRGGGFTWAGTAAGRHRPRSATSRRALEERGGFAAARSRDCGTLIPVDMRSISTDIIP